MPLSDKPRPDFAHPPVVEVALGVQFDDLPGLNAFQTAAFWAEHLKAELPDVAEQPPVVNVQETFGQPARQATSLSVQAGPPPLRFWMSNTGRTGLVQIQRNRFVFNWRRGQVAGSEYPRYPFVKGEFQRHFGAFVEFVTRRGLGEFAFNQCEVTYVNEMRAPTGGSGHAFVGDFLALHGSTNGEFLGGIESAETTYHYVMVEAGNDEPVGRLHASASPRLRADSMEAVYLLQMVARGRPLGLGPEGVVAFLDLGREYIVRGFADITTRRMHEVWGRRA
jgi:uncharacterized protein (TIGR04255 family)